MGFWKLKEIKEEEKRNVFYWYKLLSDLMYMKVWDNEIVMEDVENLEDKDFWLEDFLLKIDNFYVVNEGG